MKVLINHPSEYLTDHDFNGDGLAAFEIISELALRNEEVHVLVDRCSFSGNLRSNIFIHHVSVSSKYPTLRPFFWIINSFIIGKKVVRDFQIDIIHQLNPVEKGFSFLFTFLGKPLILGPLVAGWKKNSDTKRYRVTFLGYISNTIISNLRHLLFIWELFYASKLIISSDELFKSYQILFFKKKTVVIPFGVNPLFFCQKPKLKSNQFCQILFVGSLNKRKNLHVLLEAYEMVYKYLFNPSLLIIGDGDDKDELVGQCQFYNSSSTIHFLGKKNHSEIAFYMRSSSIYVIVSDNEPFGISAIEAIVSGIPIVGSNNGGLFHSLKNAGALTLAPGNVIQLSNLIYILSICKTSSNLFSKKNISISHKFCWTSIISKYQLLYEKAINYYRISS